MSSLLEYQHKFARLRRNRQNGGAPHKPVLLLAVIDLYGRGLISENKLYFSDLLVATFHSLWQDLVGKSAFFNPTAIYPMAHMESEGFWHLQHYPGKKLNKKALSVPHVRENLAYVKLDPALHLLLLNPDSRTQLQTSLLLTYFPDLPATFLQEIDSATQSPFDWTLQDADPDWTPDWKPPRKTSARLQFEEEKWARQEFFPKNIYHVYQSTCCVSEYGVRGPDIPQMIDACHIIPREEKRDDHIQNGIALTPTLHRAFDAFLFTITEDYRVKVSQRFRENPASPYHLRQFEGKEIRLPAHPAYRPDPRRLQWHNQQFQSREN